MWIDKASVALEWKITNLMFERESKKFLFGFRVQILLFKGRKLRYKG